ncbi:MAG: hypothetical protein Q4B27_00205 [Candidatus Saccharibacteria bacterium]|nr:hypothetical protein [Candidatus Saccharibacteria bacterium]
MNTKSWRWVRQRWRFSLVAIGLLITLSVLTVLSYQQGPRLRHAVMADDPNIGYQTVQLQFNQPVKPVEARAIRISPRADFTVTTNNATVTIQFRHRLQSNSQYHVAINQVVNAYTQQLSAASYHFDTPPAQLYYLKHRNAAETKTEFYVAQATDAIVQMNLATKHEKILYQATRIINYAVVDSRIIVHTMNDATTSELHQVDIKTGAVSPLSLPGKGTVSRLRAMDNGTVGYLFAKAGSKEKTTNLIVHDIAAQRHHTIFGLNAQPLPVYDWRPVSRGAAVVARTRGDDVLLIDPTGKHAMQPLGQAAVLGDVSYDGKNIIMMKTGDGYFALNLENSKKSSITHQQGNNVISLAAFLHTRSGYSMEITSVNQQHILQRQTILTYPAKRVIHQTTPPAYTTNITVSPNDQYTAIEQKSTADSSTKTHIIDNKTGHIVHTLDGKAVVWL